MDTQQGSEWWVERLLTSARGTNGEAEDSNTQVVASLREARKMVGDVMEQLLMAHANAEKTGTCIHDTKNALNGVSWHWNKLVPVVMQHKRLVGGLGFSACAIALAVMFYPTTPVHAAGANAATSYSEPLTVECLLLKGERDRAWVLACEMGDGPEKWFWQGEVKRGQGEEQAARVLYGRAAQRGHRLAQLAMKASGSNHRDRKA